MERKPSYEELEQKVKELQHEAAKRKQTEERLKEVQELGEKILYGSPVAFVLHDRDLRIVRLSRAYKDVTTYDPDEVLGNRVEDFMPEGRAKAIVVEALKKVRDEGVQVGPRDILAPTREERYLTETILPILDSTGNVSHVLSVLEDVTDRKRTEEALHESEEKYRELFESCKDGIVLTDMEGKILDANKAYLDMLGYKMDEIRRMTHQQLTPEKWHKIEAEIVKNQFIKRGYSDEFEKEYIKKDGTVFPMSLKGWLVKDEQGQPIGMWGFVRDITERKQAEETLRESEAMARALLNTPSDVALVIDTEGIILDANQTMARRFQKSLDELRGACIWELLPPDLAKRRKSFTDKVFQSGRPVRVEEERDGCWFDNVVHPVFDSTGKVSKVAILARDITEMKRKEKELKEKEAELRTKGEALEEVNTALRVLLKQREEDKGDLEEKVLSNVKDLVLPYVEKLKNTSLDINQTSYLSILESNLDDIVSPFARTLSSKYLSLTPTEIRVAHLVKDGKTTKEIAEFMNLSAKTIEFHRDNVRKKLGIKGKKVNLRTQLLSM